MVRNQHRDPGIVAISPKPTPNSARADPTDICEPLNSRAQRTGSLIEIVQQYLSLSRLRQRLLGSEHQIRGRYTLLEFFDPTRGGLSNPFWEARHVNGTGVAATNQSESMNAASDLGHHHVSNYQNATPFETRRILDSHSA